MYFTDIKNTNKIISESPQETRKSSFNKTSLVFGINAIKNDIIEFEKLNNEDEEADFIKNFIKMCETQYEESGIEHESDVYTLLLITAIVLKKNNIVEKILTTNRGNILTHCDSTGYSAISRTLYSGNTHTLSAVRTYIKSYIKDNNKLKLTCNVEDQASILTIMRCPKFENMNCDIYLEILEPIYLDIGKFIELLDTFD